MKKGSLLPLSIPALSLFAPTSFAASGDLVLTSENVWLDADTYLEGQSVGIWASVQNSGPNDLLGSVRFSTEDGVIDSDQPISALAGKTDEVFVNWVPSSYGTFELTVTVYPWDASLDNPDNNTVSRQVSVLQDTDRDGIPNNSDPDSDGDGVLNEEDAFPLTSSESKDTDGDGQGNNSDPDDDNDGVLDSEDALPEDSRYFEDTDGDGVADVTDAFPSNPSESKDTDGDGLGDNTDADIDGDSLGNNADPDPMNPAPSAAANDPWLAGLGEEVVFDASASEDDSRIIKYLWSFGEGSGAIKVEGAQVKHAFKNSGLQTAVLTVLDENGQSDSTEVKVRVLNYPFILKASLFALLLVLLAFMLISRYTPASKSLKKAATKKRSK